MPRPFRPIRALRRALVPDIPPLLERANEWMAVGDFPGAARAFEQLARAAEARGGPRAPFLYLQSGRACVLAGQVALGMEHLERGLGLFAARGQAGRAFALSQRIVQELNQRGLRKEAQQIDEYARGLLPDFAASASEAPAARPPLPTHCPACGAPLHSDEIEWVDAVTAECAFCGSPVRAER